MLLARPPMRARGRGGVRVAVRGLRTMRRQSIPLRTLSVTMPLAARPGRSACLACTVGALCASHAHARLIPGSILLHRSAACAPVNPFFFFHVRYLQQCASQDADRGHVSAVWSRL